MKIALYTSESPYLRARLTGTYAGFLFIILGIQGVLEIYNTSIQSINNIKLYSILMCVFGILFVIISTIRCIPKIPNNVYYDSL